MKLKFLSMLALASGTMISLSSCSNDDVLPGGGGTDDTKPGTGDTRRYMNLVVGVDVESSSGATYSAAYTDLSSTDLSISFKGWGFEVPSVRTARVYASEAGDYLYNLSYGGGTISKYQVNGGQNYTDIKTLDISLAMGTTNPRWTKLNDQYALLHNVTTSKAYADGAGSEYSHHIAKGILTAIDLQNFSIITSYHETGGLTFEFPRTEEDIEKSLHVWRIDAPVLCGGKAYYGLNKRSYDPATDENITTSDYQAATLVVDFPSLQNPKIITSGIAQGSTQGYRTPVAHVDERGDIYQLTAAPSSIIRISNETYDDSYELNLSEALGMQAGSLGWFYVGDGIGYVPFYDVERGSGSDVAAWGVARVDLYNKSAVRLNLPENLWLYQYQSGIVGDDGLFYMAIAPLGGEGHIYMFDPSSSSADAFTTGASIQTINSTSAYLGLF